MKVRSISLKLLVYACVLVTHLVFGPVGMGTTAGFTSGASSLLLTAVAAAAAGGGDGRASADCTGVKFDIPILIPFSPSPFLLATETSNSANSFRHGK